MSECQQEMMNMGGAYPRTCPTCGLGPCAKGLRPPRKPLPDDPGQTHHCPTCEALAKRVEELEAALRAVVADREYQKKTGAPHFTSAQTEAEWKSESADTAWNLARSALASLDSAEPEEKL